MNADLAIALTMRALEISILVSAPMLLFGLLVGLAVSIFQAVTQIQEMTLTFIPKIVAIVAAIAIFFPWMLATVLDYTVALISNINNYVGK